MFGIFAQKMAYVTSKLWKYLQIFFDVWSFFCNVHICRHIFIPFRDAKLTPIRPRVTTMMVIKEKQH